MMERQFPHTLPLDAGTSRYKLRFSLTWESKEKSNVTRVRGAWTDLTNIERQG